MPQGTGINNMPRNIAWAEDGAAVVIVDQTQLPNRTIYRTLREAGEFHEAIASLQVRGAPAIGICAAYAVACLARGYAALAYDDFLSAMDADIQYLDTARPTAVNLSWALRRMRRVITENPQLATEDLIRLLDAECRAIHQEDRAMCRAIAEHGLSLLRSGDGVLTHCNAGPLATSEYGTALGPLLLGQERGMRLRVFADETRPLLQGARLTSYELSKAGVDVTLICDNMAGMVMRQGWVQACLVGCDRIAANGDTANKIGTSVVAVLAQYYQIPFYVLGPTSTIDLACPDGAGINIEQRNPEEIRTMFYQQPMAPPEVPCYNPAFDVTDHQLICAIVTERGICRPPYTQSLAALFA